MKRIDLQRVGAFGKLPTSTDHNNGAKSSNGIGKWKIRKCVDGMPLNETRWRILTYCNKMGNVKIIPSEMNDLDVVIDLTLSDEDSAN